MPINTLKTFELIDTWINPWKQTVPKYNCGYFEDILYFKMIFEPCYILTPNITVKIINSVVIERKIPKVWLKSKIRW